MNDDGNPDYFYGIDYQGKGLGIIWFDSKGEALGDVNSTDAKHLPGELVRMRKSQVERSGRVYDYWPERGDMGWKQTGGAA